MTRHVKIAVASLGAAALLAVGVGSYVASPPAASCHTNGALPDPACTPGDVLPGVTAQDICTPGYATRVRNVPESTKAAVLAEYGMSRAADGDLEIDHLVSLELGGSNDLRNLFPQAAEPRPGYHEKDRLENFVHLRMVCSGQLSLSDAQKRIATDWLGWYQELQGQGEF